MHWAFSMNGSAIAAPTILVRHDLLRACRMSRQVAWEMWKRGVAAIMIEERVADNSVESQIIWRDMIIEVIDECNR